MKPQLWVTSGVQLMKICQLIKLSSAPWLGEPLWNGSAGNDWAEGYANVSMLWFKLTWMGLLLRHLFQKILATRLPCPPSRLINSLRVLACVEDDFAFKLKQRYCFAQFWEQEHSAFRWERWDGPI